MIALGFRLIVRQGVRGREFGEVKEGSPPLCITTSSRCNALKGSQHFNDAVSHKTGCNGSE